MSDSACISCRKPASIHECALCEESVCKSCVQSFNPESLSMLKEIPAELQHTKYCQHCFDETVAPVQQQYEDTLELAKEVFVFFTTQRKEIPLIRRSKEIFRVEDCDDRDETILRLAFRAAELGFNAVTEVEVSSKKVKNGRHTKSLWKGSGMAAEVDAKKVDLQDKRNEIYR